MTVLSAGDLALEIDYGAGNPLGTLQRLENGDSQDYRPDGEVITSEFLDIEGLPPGKYRVVPTEVQVLQQSDLTVPA